LISKITYHLIVFPKVVFEYVYLLAKIKPIFDITQNMKKFIDLKANKRVTKQTIKQSLTGIFD